MLHRLRGYLLGPISFALLISSASALWAQPADGPRKVRPKPLDSIVAVVGNDTISQRELAKELRLAVRKLKEERKPVPSREILAAQTLDELIMTRLQLREAARRGITLDELALDRIVENVAEKNGLSLEELRQEVEQSGLSYTDLREKIRTRQIIQRLVQDAVINRIEVSDEEIDAVLASRGQDALFEYRFAHIAVLGDSRTLHRARQSLSRRPGRSLKRLKARFKRYWKKTGDRAPYTIRDFGWRPLSGLPGALRAQIGDLSSGAFSSVIHRPDKTHLFVLLDMRSNLPDATKTVYRVRHILIQPNIVEDNDAVKRKLSHMRRDIRSGKKRFGDLARRYSVDYGSAIKDGDLGWVSPDDLVAEFAENMRNTPVGEMAGPFRTAFGWHLLEVANKKEVAANMDDVRNRIEAQIRQSKADGEVRQWLVSLRNNRYVNVLTNKGP